MSCVRLVVSVCLTDLIYRLANAIVEATEVELYGRAVLTARKVGGMEQAVLDTLPPNDFHFIDDKVCCCQ